VLEAFATGYNGLLLDVPEERRCSRFTKHRGRVVSHCAFCLDVVFLDMLRTVTHFRMN